MEGDTVPFKEHILQFAVKIKVVWRLLKGDHGELLAFFPLCELSPSHGTNPDLRLVNHNFMWSPIRSHSFQSCAHAQSLSCVGLCNPMNCSPPGFSVRGILQARILELVAIPSPGDLPDPGIEPGLLHCRQILQYQVLNSVCCLAYNCSADCNFYNYPYSCYSCYCLCTITEQWDPPECPPAPTHFRELSAMGTTNWRRVMQEPFGIDIK